MVMFFSTSEEDDVSECEYSLELIAECWIEPQHGVVAKGPPERAYMENLPYHQLADVVSTLNKISRWAMFYALIFFL